MTRKSILSMNNLEIDSDAPDQYVDKGSEWKIPVSHEGGGTNMGPYGNLAPPVIKNLDLSSGGFVTVGEGRVPDSVKFRNNSPKFLLEQSKLRERARKESNFDPVPKAVPEILKQTNLKVVVEDIKAPSLETMEEQPDLPIFAGLGLPDTMSVSGGFPESVIEKVVEEMLEESKVKTNTSENKGELILVVTPAGSFPIRYDKVDVGPDTVACIHSGDSPFSPSISNDGLEVVVHGETMRLFHRGNVFNIPGTDKTMTVFTRG